MLNSQHKLTEERCLFLYILHDESRSSQKKEKYEKRIQKILFSLNPDSIRRSGPFKGTNSLWLATFYKQWDVAEEMLKYTSVNVNAICSEKESRHYNKTSICIAAHYHKWDIVAQLMQRGADIQYGSYNKMTVASMADSYYMRCKRNGTSINKHIFYLILAVTDLPRESKWLTTSHLNKKVEKIKYTALKYCEKGLQKDKDNAINHAIELLCEKFNEYKLSNQSRKCFAEIIALQALKGMELDNTSP
ncbi:MAG: hypothetical protein LW825_03970 [Candidatus Jidaibacter sp.]|jgi:hypothetical protein|nr:hypothetical protein [Candidatus Jidaibacter sp.]